jgi:pyridoxamine 5'-phosphate oxidase family protein
MSLLSDKETAYLQGHQVGRLATTNGTGLPHVVPTIFYLDTTTGTLKIGHFILEGRGQQRLYLRHLSTNPQAAFVVDDWSSEPEPSPRGVSIKGLATLHPEGGESLNPRFGPRWLEITPTWVSSWGIDTHPYAPATPRTT